MSAAQIANDLATSVLARDPEADVGPGPVADVVINAPAPVLQNIDDRTVTLSLMVTREDPSIFDANESDLDNIVATEGLSRDPGGHSTTVLVFFRYAAIPSGQIVPIDLAWPVSTQEGDASFITSDTRKGTSATPLNPQNNRYEVQVPAISLTLGETSQVGAQTLTAPLRALNGWDGVTNTIPATGGRDRETNQELLGRYALAPIGRDVSARAGIGLNLTSLFPETQSYYVANSVTQPDIVTREDTNAVDVFVKSTNATQVTDVMTYLGLGTTHVVFSPPLVDVLSVSLGGTILVEGEDYEIVRDTTGYSGSVLARDGIQFLTAQVMGAAFLLTYTSDTLVAAEQSRFEADDLDDAGRSLLFRRGDQLDIALEANLSAVPGANYSDVKSNVLTAVTTFINTTLGLGATKLGSKEAGQLQIFDINRVVSQVSGVDNFRLTRLTLVGDPSGVADIDVACNQYTFVSDPIIRP